MRDVVDQESPRLAHSPHAGVVASQVDDMQRPKGDQAGDVLEEGVLSSVSINSQM